MTAQATRRRTIVSDQQYYNKSICTCDDKVEVHVRLIKTEDKPYGPCVTQVIVEVVNWENQLSHEFVVNADKITFTVGDK